MEEFKSLTILNFIGGEFVPSQDGEVVEDVNPATLELNATQPRSKEVDVAAAVEAAEKAYKTWSKTSTAERSEWLLKIAAKIKEKKDWFAQLESRDTGKPISLSSVVDIPRAVDNFTFFAQRIQQSHDSAFADNGALHYSLRQPVGVVGLITPWNLPIYLLSWKIAPAIAMGNTVVCKPSEMTPMTANGLAEICKEIGLPPGVVNIVYGYGGEAGASICEHPKTRIISFTGGTVSGRKVALTCAPTFKKVSLELGGKNPSLVFSDCNLEEAVAGCVKASLLNQGQVCLCGSRIFVARDIYDEFVDKFVQKAEDLAKKIGDPLDHNTGFGALVSLEHREKVERYVELAREEGGRILTGGKRPEGLKGAYYLPTVVVDLAADSRCATEEVFGPFVSIHPFDTEEEAVSYGNIVSYGLCATVWTENIRRARRVSEQLEVGMVWVNCWLKRDLRTPFGGVKDSGVGREGGDYSLEFYSETKNITLAD